MSKHTPGPWTAEPNGGDDDDLRKLFICANTGAETTIAEVFTGLEEDAEANAALIAAAPDLAEAVRELLATHPAAYREPGPIDNRTDNAIKIARAAIAKAEGVS
jgi:hypothetical protein